MKKRDWNVIISWKLKEILSRTSNRWYCHPILLYKFPYTLSFMHSLKIYSFPLIIVIALSKCFPLCEDSLACQWWWLQSWASIMNVWWLHPSLGPITIPRPSFVNSSTLIVLSSSLIFISNKKSRYGHIVWYTLWIICWQEPIACLVGAHCKQKVAGSFTISCRWVLVEDATKIGIVAMSYEIRVLVYA